MKILKLIVLSLAVMGFVFACKQTETEQVQAPSYAEAPSKEAAPSYGKETPSTPSYGEAPAYGKVAGDIEKGKALFNDPEFGNGTAGKSCNSCHLDGRGVEKAGDKKEFNIMGKKQNSLEEAVNFCIEMALKGTAIDPNGQDMKDIVTYIRSLKK